MEFLHQNLNIAIGEMQKVRSDKCNACVREWNGFHIMLTERALIRLAGGSTVLHVRWVPCHYGMARPHDADGGKASRYGG
jgi:hypothetical protein